MKRLKHGFHQMNLAVRDHKKKFSLLLELLGMKYLKLNQSKFKLPFSSSQTFGRIYFMSFSHIRQQQRRKIVTITHPGEGG